MTSPPWPQAVWHQRPDGTPNVELARRLGLSDLEIERRLMLYRPDLVRPLGATEPASGFGLIYLLGGMSVAWAAWALFTPHEEYGSNKTARR